MIYANLDLNLGQICYRLYHLLCLYIANLENMFFESSGMATKVHFSKLFKNHLHFHGIFL